MKTIVIIQSVLLAIQIISIIVKFVLVQKEQNKFIVNCENITKIEKVCNIISYTCCGMILALFCIGIL